MRFGISLIALFALCEPVLAQTSDCLLIQKASERLACYDRASPPLSRNNLSAKHKAAARHSKGDFLEDETARVGKKIGNICRGC
jgi:hypothetical protein